MHRLSTFLPVTIFIAVCTAGSALGADGQTKVLKISQATDFSIIDPALTSAIEDSNIIEQMLEGLTMYDPKTSLPIPAAAKKWDISKDLKTYTFHLRKEARWSDGSPVRAGDFIYAWKRILSPVTGSTWAYELFCVKNAKKYYERKLSDFSQVGISAPDDLTLVVELAYPHPYFLAWLSHTAMAPLKEGVVETLGREWTSPGKMPANGPFMLKFREPKDKTILAKNPKYWDAKKVALDEVIYLPVEDENTGLKMYEAGMLDIDAGTLPASRIQTLFGRKDLQVADYLGIYFYRFNTKKEPFSSKKVRQAFNISIDKKVIAEKILKGGQKPAYNLVPEGIDWYKPVKGAAFDPQKGRELLASEGYCVKGIDSEKCKPFPKTEILFNTMSGHKNIAEAIQSMIRENLGIDNVEVINRDFKTVLASTRKGNFDLVRGGWIADYVDPVSFLSLWMSDSGNNLTGFADPRYDELIKKSENTIKSRERASFFTEAEKILNDELPALPIYFFVRLYLKQDYVKGYYPNILDKHPMKFVSIDKR